MNKYRLFFLGWIVLLPNVCRGSFLTAQKFPATFQDVPFVQRVAVIKEGYEPYKSEYDSEGRCIKNCAYTGITIKEEQEYSRINTQNAVVDSMKYEQAKQTKKTQPYTDTQKIVSAVIAEPEQKSVVQCANRNPNIKSGQDSPWGEPVIGNPRISSPYGPRYLSGKPDNHHAIDYAVPKGTLVYTPADGRVVNVWHDGDGCGNGVKIQNNDGTYVIYCHLENSFVNVGDIVQAGCAVAESGNTGHSTGPHLHYGMMDKNGNYFFIL